ncbi:hypothetical protein RJ640_025389 [Escallonia rubra]|uniref:J domain-containing protein n=1 Tax=Escallonia rubra TaxID=112253 RepID=A0AA88URW1_9ASTE|nr:hypothetical protein RJ640_025389 [Escallonia rubra]
MDCTMISNTPPRFHLSPKSYQSTESFMSSSHLLFSTHLTKPSFSIKTSHRTRRANATINSLYATVQPKQSFYELLGISESGTLSEIKKAYKQLARKYHPDVSPPERTEEYTKTFIRVQEAYETLSDPQTRALYDIDMSRGLHLAFSARKRGQNDQRSDGDWKNRWQAQVMELKRRGIIRESRGSMSWGSRIRGQRSEAYVHGFDNSDSLC